MKNIKDAVFEDKDIQKFCDSNKISDSEFSDGVHLLVMQKENNAICGSCDGKECKMDPLGLQTRLVYRGKIDIEYFDCPIMDYQDPKQINMLYFPNSADFKNRKMDLSSERALAVKLMMQFKNNYRKGEFTRGLYFHGPFGTGKTYLMYTLAKDLAKKNSKVLMAYYPDLVRFIKSSIGTQELEKTINELKYVDILMLDDIGAENNTGFIRDEVLGPILQFRLESNLPVCFTSNLNLELLQEHFMESKDEVNRIKSDRIIERIRALTHQSEIKGKNYRTNEV